MALGHTSGSRRWGVRDVIAWAGPRHDFTAWAGLLCSQLDFLGGSAFWVPSVRRTLTVPPGMIWKEEHVRWVQKALRSGLAPGGPGYYCPSSISTSSRGWLVQREEGTHRLFMESEYQIPHTLAS